jgi:Gamma tubulin complex component C-terminal
MADAQDMDEVMGLHERFLDSCLKECLLASQELLRILTKLMTTCLMFADQMKRFSGERGTVPCRQVLMLIYMWIYVLDIRNKVDADVAMVASRTTDQAAKKLQLRNARLSAQAAYITKETSHESFNKMLTKFSETFDIQVWGRVD